MTDASGTKVASYRYDPWGKVLKPHDDELAETADVRDIADINHYLYAGYRYDYKTKLYFLKTRYYNQ